MLSGQKLFFLTGFYSSPEIEGTLLGSFWLRNIIMACVAPARLFKWKCPFAGIQITDAKHSRPYNVIIDSIRVKYYIARF